MNAQRTPTSNPVVRAQSEYWWATASADVSEPGFVILSSTVYDKKFMRLADLQQKVSFSSAYSEPGSNVESVVIPFCVGPRRLCWWYLERRDFTFWSGVLVSADSGVLDRLSFADPLGTFRVSAVGLSGVAGVRFLRDDVSDLVVPREWEFAVLRFTNCDSVLGSGRSGGRGRNELSESNRLIRSSVQRVINGQTVGVICQGSYSHAYRSTTTLLPDTLYNVPVWRCDNIPPVDVLYAGSETVTYVDSAVDNGVGSHFMFEVPHGDLLVYDRMSDGRREERGVLSTRFTYLDRLYELSGNCINSDCSNGYKPADVCCAESGRDIIWEIYGYSQSASVVQKTDERTRSASGTLLLMSGNRQRSAIGAVVWSDYVGINVATDFAFDGGWVSEEVAGGSLGYVCLVSGRRRGSRVDILVTDAEVYEGIDWQTDDPLLDVLGLPPSAVFVVDDRVVSFASVGGKVVARYRDVPSLRLSDELEAPSGRLWLVHHTRRSAAAWGVA